MKAEAVPSAPASAPALAQLPRRLAAIVYDSLLLAGVLFAATALALGLTVAAAGSESVKLNHPMQGHPLFSSYLLLICFFFFGGFWVFGGQTLGMRAWRLRVQRRDGRGVGWWQALMRFLSAGIWPVPVAAYLDRVLGVGVGLSLAAGFACLVLVLALRLPDRLSETELVVLPKKPKP
ncbi:MAG: RDD family protein [Candidatus Competibacter sp.]|nr:RDD family protein [Candidatus Competibacteraceae bacterium]